MKTIQYGEVECFDVKREPLMNVIGVVSVIDWDPKTSKGERFVFETRV